jgi:UDP-N-acetylmuramoyl-tripeptide--D-alanyl-D-alanine ligase
VLHVVDAAAAQVETARLLGKDDVLLVKGSNSVGLGRVVAALRDEGGEGPK